MKLRWTNRARQDLVDIGRYIGEDNPQAARRWVARLRKRAQQASDSPQSARVVPELMRDDVREVIERTYRLVYRIQTDTVDVLTVFEGHRQLRASELEEDT